jgi:hypothetical protein
MEFMKNPKQEFDAGNKHKVANISENFRKNSQWPLPQGPGGI